MARIIARVLISAASAALIQTHGPPARADDAAAETDRGGGLEEIVVTARKRSESVQVTPVAVSALSADDMEAAHLTRLDDLSALAPNLTITENTGAVGVAQMTIRGIVNADYNLMNDSPVAIYLDGVIIARATGALMGLADLERVEVLRGPQGTLYGRNTTGGAVNLYTKGPAADFGFEQKLSYGSHNDLISRSTLDSGKLGPFTAKLTYVRHQYDGYYRNLQTDSSDGIGAIHSDGFLFALHGDLTDHFTLDYKFDHDEESDRPGYYQVTAASGTLPAVYANSAALGGVPLVVSPTFQGGSVNQTDLGPSRLNIQGHSVTLNYELSDAFRVRSITAYRSVGTVYNTVIGPGPLFATIGEGGPSTGFAPYVVGNNDLFDNHELDRQHQTSEEINFSGQIQRFNYVAGLYYFDEKVALDSLGHLAAFVPLPNFPISLLVPQPLSYSGESRSYAGYSNVSYTPPVLDDKLELTVGLRETQDRKVLHQNFFDAAGNPIAGAAGFRDVARDFGNFSESASTKYQWDEDLMTYFRWSKAYKAGGFNPRSTGSLSATGFGPELASSYELGVKSELLNRHLRLNVDGFYTDYTNLQVSVIEPSSAGVQTITDNAGKARYTGGEFEMAVLPLTGWEVDVTVGYVIPKFLEYKTSPTTDIADIAKFGSTSKATTNLRVQYSLPHLACGAVTLAANWAYLSSRYFGSNPLTAPFLEDIKSPGWNNVGAQITLADIPTGSIGKSLEVQLYGKNLLNAIQRVDGIDFGSSLGYAVNGYGPGREFGIALTAKF